MLISRNLLIPSMKKVVKKERISVSLNRQVLEELDVYCSKTKPVPADRSPVVEIAIKEYLAREKK